MGLGVDLLKKLKKTYEPSSMINIKYRGKDVAFKTDPAGNPIQLFIGRMNDDGIVKGERYSRHLVTDQDGKVVKDHWDLKGKSS